MSLRRIAPAALLALTASGLAHAAQAAPSCAAGTLSGAAALNSSWADDKPGLCRQIKRADLPPVGTSNASFATVIPRPQGAWPRVPAGFSVTQFYQDDTTARLLRAAPNGDLFLAESDAGRVRVFRPAADGTLAKTAIFAANIYRPFGIAFYPPGPNPAWVYVAGNDQVVRFPYVNGDLKARGKRQVIVPDLPQGAGQLPGRGHWTRDVQFSADGATMFVSVGSYSNAQENNEDETDRADILSFTPDGANRQVFASGIRNPVSLAVSPFDGRLWTSVNERDGMGDNLVPDYLTAVQQGQFYGWPWFYIGPNVDTVHHANDWPRQHPPVKVPSVLLQAHSASLGSVFYTGGSFPLPYGRGLFVAEHGSWNRANPTGSKVIRVNFSADGRNSGLYEDFMTGFVVSNHEVWGRPVGVAVGKDGALYVSEDANNVIWRVQYTGP